MSFHEKSAAITLAGLVIWYGIYFALHAEMILSGEGVLAASTAILFITMIGFVAIVAAGHIVVAIFMEKGDDKTDERERFISLKAERNGGFILGVGVVLTLGLMLVGATNFAAANALLFALFVSEAVSLASKLVYYRQAI